MAQYSVNGEHYNISLFGLVIECDSNKKNVFLLSPVDDNLERYFENDPKWVKSGDNRAIILYANANNLREVDRLVYIAWERVDDPDNIEIEVELSEADRAYLNGLLNQWFGKDIEY